MTTTPTPGQDQPAPGDPGSAVPTGQPAAEAGGATAAPAPRRSSSTALFRLAIVIVASGVLALLLTLGLNLFDARALSIQSGPAVVIGMVLGGLIMYSIGAIFVLVITRRRNRR